MRKIAVMSRAYIFVYGVVKSKEPVRFAAGGIDNLAVDSLSHDGVAALVSRTPFMSFEAFSKEALLSNLARYQAVLEKVMDVCQVLPVKYGTFLPDEEALQAVLVAEQAGVLGHFERMRQKLELDVVVLWQNLPGLLAEIGATPEIAGLKRNAAGIVAPEAATEHRLVVGKMVKEMLDSRSRKRASEVLDALNPWVDECLSHPLMDDTMIMNTAFLLKRQNRQVVEDCLERLDQSYGQSVLFRLVGPLPPYSFCTLEIQQPDIRQILEAGKTLGLGKEATALEIREAYWKLTKAFHPDFFPGDKAVQTRFETIARAYRTLCDNCRDDRICFEERPAGGWGRIRCMKPCVPDG